MSPREFLRSLVWKELDLLELTWGISNNKYRKTNKEIIKIIENNIGYWDNNAYNAYMAFIRK